MFLSASHKLLIYQLAGGLSNNPSVISAVAWVVLFRLLLESLLGVWRGLTFGWIGAMCLNWSGLDILSSELAVSVLPVDRFSMKGGGVNSPLSDIRFARCTCESGRPDDQIQTCLPCDVGNHHACNGGNCEAGAAISRLKLTG